MRFLIRAFDRLLARLNGIYEFCQDPKCILRMQIAKARHDVSLPGLMVRKGDRVLMLHFWNAHLPPVPASGASISWAIQSHRLLIHSLQAAAIELETDTPLGDIPAIGAVFSLLPESEESGGQNLVRRLGFSVFPYRGPMGRFGEFVENVYSWLLIYAYNPGSLTSRKLSHLHRFEIWMTRKEFLHIYAPDQIPEFENG